MDSVNTEYRIQIYGREISGKQTESLKTSGGGGVSEHHIENEIHTNRVRNGGPSFKSEPFDLNIFRQNNRSHKIPKGLLIIPTIIIFFLEWLLLPCLQKSFNII